MGLCTEWSSPGGKSSILPTSGIILESIRSPADALLHITHRESNMTTSESGSNCPAILSPGRSFGASGETERTSRCVGDICLRPGCPTAATGYA
jgi:hypothetical protein